MFCHYHLQYHFNAFVLLKTVFNLKLKFKLKIDPKTSTFKNLEEIQKAWKNFSKTIGHHDKAYFMYLMIHYKVTLGLFKNLESSTQQSRGLE